MKTIASYVILMLVCLLGTFSIGESVIYTKSCLTFEEQYTFKENKFMGKWYEVRRLYDPLDPEQEDCVVMSYRLLEMGAFEIMKSFQMTKDGQPIYASGKAEPRVFHESRIPQFYERLNTTNAADPDTSVDIVTTDYENYAILYSCTSINSTHHLEASWVLSRLPELEKKEDQMVDLYLQRWFKRSDHEWRATMQMPEFCKPSIVDGSSHSGASTDYHPLASRMMLLLVLLPASTLAQRIFS
ncbi:apolipoprotein D-like [Anopheles aquasalis]|uniref:apolipoprotein D-like n=1 Tax=Anopheles aquasalis TaxID=42839 RepID=UPI00215A22BE|nr:apolipoprotein D-like [Anopheles aquasalis]